MEWKLLILAFLIETRNQIRVPRFQFRRTPWTEDTKHYFRLSSPPFYQVYPPTVCQFTRNSKHPNLRDTALSGYDWRRSARCSRWEKHTFLCNGQNFIDYSICGVVRTPPRLMVPPSLRLRARTSGNYVLYIRQLFEEESFHLRPRPKLADFMIECDVSRSKKFLVGFEAEFVLLDPSGEPSRTVDPINAWSVTSGLAGYAKTCGRICGSHASFGNISSPTSYGRTESASNSYRSFESNCRNSCFDV